MGIQDQSFQTFQTENYRKALLEVEHVCASADEDEGMFELNDHSLFLSTIATVTSELFERSLRTCRIRDIGYVRYVSPSKRVHSLIPFMIRVLGGIRILLI